jgi:hypothetical protein
MKKKYSRLKLNGKMTIEGIYLADPEAPRQLQDWYDALLEKTK